MLLAHGRLIKTTLCTLVYVLLDFTYSANSRPWAAVAAVKYVQVYKAFPIAYISHGIYMARGLINAMIKLLIVYFVMTRVN